MYSKFVGAIRRLDPYHLHHLKGFNEDLLRELGDKLIKECKKLAKRGGDHALNAISTDLQELLREESKIKERIKWVLAKRDEKCQNKYLSDKELSELDLIEAHREKLAELLYLIADYKGIMYELIIGYFNEAAEWSEEAIADMRNTLPGYNEYRLQFERAQKERAPESAGEIEGKGKVVAAKYYAVLQWLRIKLKMDEPFEKNNDDKWPKAEIIRFAKSRYPEISPQMFYREFTSDDITNAVKYPSSWGRDYKDKIIQASKNDHKIILALKNWPR